MSEYIANHLGIHKNIGNDLGPQLNFTMYFDIQISFNKTTTMGEGGDIGDDDKDKPLFVSEDRIYVGFILTLSFNFTSAV